MDINTIAKQFMKMGARVNVSPTGDGRARMDVLTDKDGEYYDLKLPPDRILDVVDVQPDDRHLLLVLKSPPARPGLESIKDKYLCGHDERHWFIAGVPGNGISNVDKAKDALKPDIIREKQSSIRKKKRNKRHNELYKRQGEWFFTPTNIQVDKKLILKNEPLSRGRGSKPHHMEYAYRKGGEMVYVHPIIAPSGCHTHTYTAIIAEVRTGKRPKSDGMLWRTMSRNPELYAMGRISHSDHATIMLDSWHRVHMNTENRARGMQHVTFLD